MAERGKVSLLFLLDLSVVFDTVDSGIRLGIRDWKFSIIQAVVLPVDWGLACVLLDPELLVDSQITYVVPSAYFHLRRIT